MQNHRTLQMIFPLLLFLVFSICSLFLLTVGVDAYQNLREQGSQDQNLTTALAYVKTKVDTSNLIEQTTIKGIEDHDCLVLSNELDGTIYNTYIYTYDNQLMELLIPKEKLPYLKDGTPIMELNELTFHQDENRIRLQVQDINGNHKQLQLYVKNGAGQ